MRQSSSLNRVIDQYTIPTEIMKGPTIEEFAVVTNRQFQDFSYPAKNLKENLLTHWCVCGG